MTDFSRTGGELDTTFRAGAAAVALMVLTSMHHAYGAFAFNTPWRMHIILIAAPVALLIVALLVVARATPSPRLRATLVLLAIAVMLVFPAVMIGFYEGGYNHAVKNAVYFLFGEGAAQSLFPGAMYEMPSDFIFEATGIGQLPLGWLTALLCVRALQSRSWR